MPLAWATGFGPSSFRSVERSTQTSKPRKFTPISPFFSHTGGELRTRPAGAGPRGSPALAGADSRQGKRTRAGLGRPAGPPGRASAPGGDLAAGAWWSTLPPARGSQPGSQVTKSTTSQRLVVNYQPAPLTRTFKLPNVPVTAAWPALLWGGGGAFRLAWVRPVMGAGKTSGSCPVCLRELGPTGSEHGPGPPGLMSNLSASLSGTSVLQVVSTSWCEGVRVAWFSCRTFR